MSYLLWLPAQNHQGFAWPSSLAKWQVLSSKFNGMNEKHLWECEKGHRWDALPSNILAGKWCPECRKLTLDEMHELAHKRHGKCLSNEYVNVKTHLHWECADYHAWWATPGSIKYNGSWCPYCAFGQRKEEVKFAHLHPLSE